MIHTTKITITARGDLYSPRYEYKHFQCYLSGLQIPMNGADAEEFCASMHIRGVRLHFLPKSDKGSPALYQDIMFEEEGI